MHFREGVEDGEEENSRRVNKEVCGGCGLSV